MIEDLVKSFKASMYDRVSDPFMGSFILSGCLWNWKPIFTLVSSKLPVEQRILNVQSLYFPDIYADLIALVIPLGFSLFYTFGYPFIKLGIIKFNSWITRWIRNIKEAYENDIRLTIEQSQKLRKKYDSEVAELKISTKEDEELQRQLISEVLINYKKANNLDINDVNVLYSNTNIEIGIWVSSLDHKSATASTQRIEGVYGLVIKRFTNKYCLVLRTGVVEGIFDNLIPDSFYYLKPMSGGQMTSIVPKQESIRLGKAKTESSFEINIEVYNPSSRLN